jgi:molecular chaperone Hsp33
MSEPLIGADAIHTFTFDGAPVRGRIVRLNATWRTIRTRHVYPPNAERLLGEMLAIVAMLAHGIKLDGSVILQTRGHGAIRTAMVECADRTRLRGIVRSADPLDSDVPTPNGAQLAITLKPHRGEMYQGIVPMERPSIARAVEGYFANSEQLPTRIWAAASPDAVAGLLLQRMPEGRVAGLDPIHATDVDWLRLQTLAANVADRDLLEVAADQLLMRLFPGEAVRLQPARPLEFGCSCSRERTANALRIMGRDEIEEILAQEGRIDVKCEFCGQHYAYDPIDARLLFEPLAHEPPETPQ